MKGVFLLILGCFIGVSATRASDLTTIATKEGKIVVKLTGEIVEGDAQKLSAIIRSANAARKVVAGIRLNSPGGQLLEGAKVADLVRYAKLVTSVAAGSKCASACFLIFAAGSEKYANYSAEIGVHGASEDGRETQASGAATVGMAKAARSLGVPPSIIGKMVVTSPDQMVWLSPSDLQSMGTIMVGRPAQSPPVNGPTSILPPQQLPSNLNANLEPQSKSKFSWSDAVTIFEGVSAKQNSGQPKFIRTCQPELKSCVTGIYIHTENGGSSILKTTTNLDGKTISKEICEFNSFGDVRTCTDWDTKLTHKDMKNDQGNWIAVE